MDKLETVLQQIREGDTVPEGGWDVLSALADERLATFRILWESLDASDRLSLLDTLHTEAEAQAHLDFTPIWDLALRDPAAKVRLAGIDYSADEEGQWLIDPLLRLAAHDPEANVRAAAADALGRFAYLSEVGSLSPRRAADIERALLDSAARTDEAASVRGNALASAGYLSTPAVRDAIRAAHADPPLRRSAVRAMGRNCDPNWTEALLRDTTSRDAGLREESARAIGEIEDDRGVERLVELLEDPAVAVRLAAIWALGEIGGQDAQEALMYCLEDKQETVREAAEAALTELAFRDDPLAL
jgi:HEAT repeat protein